MATSTPLWLPVIYFIGFFLVPVSLADICDDTLDGGRGVITSPNFPDEYPLNSECEWMIEVPPTSHIVLTFTEFDVEDHETCGYDRVVVHGKPSPEEEWESLGNFCGSDLPPPITFKGSQLYIKFVSDPEDTKKGFSARYFFDFSAVPVPTAIPPKTTFITVSSTQSTLSTNSTPITLSTMSTPLTLSTNSTPLTLSTSSTAVSLSTRATREVSSDEVGSARTKLFNWFMSLRKNGTQTRKWGHQLTRIAVALFLDRQGRFEHGTIFEMNYELTIQLLSKMIGGGQLKRRDLSLYIPALMVACVDPRNFHGRDLVAELRSDIESNNGTVSPFELLVLCNAGDAMSNRDVHRIATIFDSQHRPFWTDNQAMATLALACVSAQPGVAVDERTLLDMAQELKKRQFRNGTVDNIKTTALVIQALIATQSLERDFDLGAAIRSLLAAQREDGSVGSFLDSYYVLPVLSNSTLLNITAQHCKIPEISESEALNEIQGIRGSRVSITYSVVIGTDVDLKRTWTLKVPVNSSLYNIMEMVQKLDSRQQVEYNVIEGKPYVTSLMGIQDDVETDFYWFTYLRKHNSEDSILVEESPVDVKMEANQELILWYKSGEWNKP